MLFTASDSLSYETNFTKLPLTGLPLACNLLNFVELFLISLRYFCSIFPYLSFERLTNDLIVTSNSFFICEASFLSSMRLEPNIIDNRYSNARPLPVTPTLVSVDAGNRLLSASNAFAFVAAL